MQSDIFHSINLKQLPPWRDRIMHSCIIDAISKYLNSRGANLQRRKLCKHIRSPPFYPHEDWDNPNKLSQGKCFSTEQRFRIVTIYLSGRCWNFKLTIEYNSVRASSLCRPIMTATSFKSSAVSAFQLYI